MLDAMRDDVAPELQLLVRAMVQILVIELLAYHTFAWASDVLGDPSCSHDADFARATIDHIRTDEDLHVGHLQCALAELATMTVRSPGGGTVRGADLIVAASPSALENQTGARFDRVLDYRLAQVRAELEAHPDGTRLVAEFDALATSPAEALAWDRADREGSTVTERPPVSDWATDFDHLDPDFITDPYPIYDHLRQHCPMTLTRSGGHGVSVVRG
jgi:hypothetical protein